MEIDRNAEPTLAVDEIQGDILVGLQKDFEWFIGFNIEPTKLVEFKAFLRDRLTPVVTTTRQALQHEHQINAVKHLRPKVTLNIVSINVGFSFKGLNALKVPGLNQISDEPFKGGLAAASASLGDSTDPANEGNPGRWKVGGVNERSRWTASNHWAVAAGDRSRARSQLEHFAGTSWSIVYAEVGTTRFLGPWTRALRLLWMPSRSLAFVGRSIRSSRPRSSCKTVRTLTTPRRVYLVPISCGLGTSCSDTRSRTTLISAEKA